VDEEAAGAAADAAAAQEEDVIGEEDEAEVSHWDERTPGYRRETCFLTPAFLTPAMPSTPLSACQDTWQDPQVYVCYPGTVCYASSCLL
jgi:hypothetical protein